MTNHTDELATDYTLEQVAKALGMSTRWVRDQIKAGDEPGGNPVEHIRRGHKIRFTADQVETFRQRGVKQAPIAQSITTGKKKSR